MIVLGVQHDYERIAQAPEEEAGAEVIRQYGRAAGAAKAVAGWIRGQGWEAEPVTGPLAGSITLIPPAIACGFGELGKHGSIINPELGASFRLAGVLTDAPFAPTPQRKFGVDDFCTACRICEEACPPEALSPHKQWVRGEEKWYVDFDCCLPFFNQTNGCAICIAVCPWSRPGVGPEVGRQAGAAQAERKAEDRPAKKADPPGTGFAAIRAIDYSIIYVRDMEAMRAFYEQVLGFELARELSPNWLEYHVGSNTFVLARPGLTPEDAPLPEGSAALQLAFRVPPPDVDRCAETLRIHGVEPLSPPMDREFGHRTLFFRDPDGNVLEIYAEI